MLGNSKKTLLETKEHAVFLWDVNSFISQGMLENISTDEENTRGKTKYDSTEGITNRT